PPAPPPYRRLGHPHRCQTRRVARADLHQTRPEPVPARHRRRAVTHRPSCDQGRAASRRQVPAALLGPKTVGRGHRDRLQTAPGSRTRLARHEIRARPAPGLPPPPPVDHQPTPPSRNDNETTTTCPVCGNPFTPIRRQRYCTPACRQQAWRRRHHTPTPEPVIVLPPRTPRRAITVYHCPGCDT